LDQKPIHSFVMTAGAGSGKTTSLVKALAHLAATKGPQFRQRGQRVACITYTEVAVGEI
jgi:DNA helicase-2/ATP-dependent DNA helicase PcrA